MSESQPSLGALFAAEIQEQRERRGITRNALARELTAAGAPMQQVQVKRIEEGTRGVTLDEAVVMADVLGLDLDGWIQRHRELSATEAWRLNLDELRALHRFFAEGSTRVEDLIRAVEDAVMLEIREGATVDDRVLQEARFWVDSLREVEGSAAAAAREIDRLMHPSRSVSIIQRARSGEHSEAP